ncbi:MAG: hypothetical protein O7J95_21910 [Planctomycetota bacterium]|nr:hypothetical protein [Planctomycetota bacterium]
MQFLENWDPLNLPRGSVRAIITLILLGVLWVQMLFEQPVSVVYASLILLIVGHYFGSLRPDPSGEKPRRPLGLPRGSIRTIILVGFAVVSFKLWRDGKLALSTDNLNTTILGLVGALLIGFLVRSLADLVTGGKPNRLRRLFENFKSAAAIVATVVLAIVSCLGQEEEATQKIALFSAPLVGFYFGSRY